MSELEKAKLLLLKLSTCKLELEGAKEAFKFTQAYQWLYDKAKELEETENGNK